MRRHIAVLSIVLTPVTLLAAGCGADNPTVGQSGSEFMDPSPDPVPPIVPPGIPGPSHCPCGQLGGQQALRATVTASEAFPEVGVVRYTLRADGLLSPASADDEIAVGDSFGGYWNGQLPCGGEAQFGVGDEVAAFFRRGEQDRSQCCELLACVDQAGCRAFTQGSEDEDLGEAQAAQAACEQSCAADTASTCKGHHAEALLRGELTLLLWGETLTVGTSERGEAVITAEQLSYIGRPDCAERVADGFPALHPPDPEEEPDTDTELGAAEGASPPLPPAMSAPLPSDSAPSGAPDEAPPPGTNVSAPAGMTPDSAPPAHPEEIRVRCAQ